MSYEIDYRRFAITIPAPATFRGPIVVGVCEAGPSNCFDENNRRTRSFCTLAVAYKTTFMEQVIKTSVGCETGTLKLSGRSATPEGYIKAWRKAVNEAVPIHEYVEHAMMPLTLELRPSAQDWLEELQTDEAAVRFSGRAREAAELSELLTQSECVTESGTTDPVHGRIGSCTRIELSRTHLDEGVRALQQILDLGPPRLKIACERFNDRSWKRAQETSRIAADAA